MKRFHPMVSARLSVALHPIGAAVLAVFGAAAASAPFTILHGAGSGILTIARGTVPLAIFGPENYGYRLGLLGAPTRIATAAAPLLFGMLIDRYRRRRSVVFSGSRPCSPCGPLFNAHYPLSDRVNAVAGFLWLGACSHVIPPNNAPVGPPHVWSGGESRRVQTQALKSASDAVDGSSTGT